MPRVPSVAQMEQSARPVATVARKLAVTGRCCARCGSTEIRPSNHRNAIDILLACVFIVPFRCRACRKRFYLLWRPSLHQTPGKSTAPAVNATAAPVLVMPARTQALKLGTLSRRRRELVVPSPVAASVEAASTIKPDQNPAFASTPGIVAQSEAAITEAPALPRLVNVPNDSRDTGSNDATAPRAILILESDLSIRKLLRRLLERRGHSIVEIEQPNALTTQLRRCRPDLLIVDISPTAEIGATALISIARVHPGLKILALSSEALAFVQPGDEIATRLMALRKPFALPAFVDVVDLLLKSSTVPAP